MHLDPRVPVLALPGGRVRVGLDQPLEYRPRDDREAAALARLEKGHRDARGRAAHRGDSRPVRLLGACAVGSAIAASLAAAGAPLEVEDRRPAGAGDPHPPGGGAESRAQALVRDLARGSTAITALPCARAASLPALTVVIADGVVSPERSHALMAADATHLPVIIGDRGLEVGPLVVPGVTSCLRCRSLARVEQDADWPLVEAQLLGRRAWSPPPRPAAALAGALAAALVLEHLAGEGAAPGWWVPFAGAELRPRSAPVHPDCGCGASGDPARYAPVEVPPWPATISSTSAP